MKISELKPGSVFRISRDGITKAIYGLVKPTTNNGGKNIVCLFSNLYQKDRDSGDVYYKDLKELDNHPSIHLIEIVHKED